MNRKIPASVALAVTIIAMTVTFSITWILSMSVFNSTMSSVTQLQAQYSKLAEIDTYVRGNYYGDIDDDYLFDRVANGYINGLGDKYAAYYTEEEYARLVRVESGQLTGIGIEILRDTDGFRIVRVYEGSPAESAGVTIGGRITSVDGEDVRNLSSVTALQNRLLGEAGTECALNVQYGLTEEEAFSVRRRENYATPTVEFIDMDDYYYIRISAFTTATYAEFSYAVGQAENAGVKGIVFDVRGTSGQFQLELYDIIDMLCPQGTVAKRVDKTGTVRVLATSDEDHIDLPMVVLVNEGTAAAAELFAVSVRDLAGGQIVGTTTAGWGSIQSSPIRLADGSAIVVTTAMLLTGRDEDFNGVGILPDVESLPVEGFDEAMLYNPDPTYDSQIQRSFLVAQAMVRERGEDPGNVGMTPTPSPIPDASLPEEDDGTSGDDEETDASEPEETSGDDSSQEADSSEAE